MSSVDRFVQLNSTKQFLRLWKKHNANDICSNSRIIPINVLATDSWTEKGNNGTNSLVPVGNCTLDKKFHDFTLMSPLRESPKCVNLRVIELDDKWKYWIPTKKIKKSFEDIIVKEKSTDVFIPDIIQLPSHAPSSYNKHEILKNCKYLRINALDEVTFHEKRKLPKEVTVNVMKEIGDPKSVQMHVEEHLTPVRVPLEESESLENLSKTALQDGKAIDRSLKGFPNPDDSILLCSSQNSSSPNYKFSPGKRCSPGRISEIANLVVKEIDGIAIPGYKPDYTFFDDKMTLVCIASTEKETVAATSLNQYKAFNTTFRVWLSTKLEVQSNVIRLKPDHDKGKVCVRWRLKTLSPLSIFSLSNEKRYEYYNYYSEFMISDDGLVNCHVMSKVTPNEPGEKVSVNSKLTAAAVSAAMGLSPLGNEAFSSTPHHDVFELNHNFFTNICTGETNEIMLQTLNLTKLYK